MKHITWLGDMDNRILNAEDLKRAGVEIKEDLNFRRLEAVEVTNAVAKALTENPNLFGRFSVVEDDKVEEGDQLDFSQLEASKVSEAQGETLDIKADSGFEATTTASSAGTTTPTATTGTASTVGRSSRNAKADR